ncbi:hypothetical protein XELAEV_18029212mg [Xenopus laevis]|uniref:Uncharacterized protein n=1 Tax=Xenopus laevis TaxID=8355 RepID=A0A974HHC2_XENLA|nr:hypothetical protein XELAEV_18029212mg [Xenopus laevis]
MFVGLCSWDYAHVFKCLSEFLYPNIYSKQATAWHVYSIHLEIFLNTLNSTWTTKTHTPIIRPLCVCPAKVIQFHSTENGKSLIIFFQQQRKYKEINRGF